MLCEKLAGAIIDERDFTGSIQNDQGRRHTRKSSALVSGHFGCVFRFGDVRGELHDFFWLAIFAENRTIRGLEPNFVASFGEALILASIEFTASETRPKCAVLG